MKKIVLLIGIVLLSLSAHGQINFSKYVRGQWKSSHICIIPTETTPTYPGATVAYKIDNYHYNLNIKRFLWLKRYVVVSTDDVFSYDLNKSTYVTTDLPNTGKNGEIVGKITLSDLRMETGKCDCLLDKNQSITYTAVIYATGNIMIWIPEPSDTTNINYSDIYLRSLRWVRPDYEGPIPDILPSDINPVIIAIKSK